MKATMKKIFSFLMALTVVMGSISIQSLCVQAADSNAALGKTVTTSTVEAAMPGNTGDKTVDGDTSTRWSSERMKQNNATEADPQTPQWLVIDLAAKKTSVTELRISFYMKVWASKYQIQTADTNTEATQWETLKTVERAGGSLPDHPTDTFRDISALKRYVRFYFEKVNVNAGGTGVSVTEIAVMGSQEETVTTAAGELSRITELPGITVNDTQVNLPEVADGYEIKVVGSTKEQVISNDGKITSHNIGDREVTLLVEILSEEDSADTARGSFTVTVPSKNGEDPEIFKPVKNPNEKPKVIPSLQEWYGYEGRYQIEKDTKIVVHDGADAGILAVAENMQADLAEICGILIPVETGTVYDENDIYIESLEEDVYEVGEEGYFMIADEEGLRICSSTYTGCLYGTITAEQILWQEEEIPYGVIRDYPDYEIRGVMFDVGRIPHRLQYLQDYTKILNWYKLNEFHLHLNDDFEYNADGLPVKVDTEWSGMHRLESDVFPGLNKKEVYTGEKFEYFNEEYADPTYTKEEYRELEKLANSRGIDLIAELDTPSHSTAYIEYAAENPDEIPWLGEINTTTSSAFNNQQMLALDINSSNQTEKQHAINARAFISALYEDYLGGENPVFASDTVHVGADEYWDKSNPEAFRGYVNFLAELMESYGKTARMWGAQKMFPGTTEISPDNIVLDEWATYEDDPILRMKEGYRVVNVPQPYLYNTPGRDHKDMIGEEYLYKNWDVTIFNMINDHAKAEPGEPLLLGAKTAIWGDEFREGITEADTHERILRAAAMVAEKTWGGQTEEDSYIDYQKAFEKLAEGPGTQIAHHIKSQTEVIVDYDPADVKETDQGVVVKDASGNGYDALLANGTVEKIDGKNMIAFDGTTLLKTPLTTLGYPYTISFEVQAADGNTADSLLFSGYDGQLRVKGASDGQMSIKRSFYTQSAGYELPKDKAVTVTVVGTFQNTKIYADGKLVKMLQSTDTGNTEEYWSTFVFPMEEIGDGFHGYLGRIKAYNKALTPEIIHSDGAEVTEINAALNAEAYAERFGTAPALNSGDLKRHPAWKATDGDKGDPDADIASTDANSYWLSSNNDGDYLMTDLGEVRDVSKVAVTWEGTRYASAFAVELSEDGETWNRVKTVTGNTSAKNVLTLDMPIKAQFVKIQGITRNTDYYAVRELEVFEKVDKTSLKAELAKVLEVIREDAPDTSDMKQAKKLKEALALAGRVLENPFTTTKRAVEAAEELEEALKDYEEAKNTPPVTEVFTDVYVDWYTDYVQYVYDNELMTGIRGTTRFEPGGNITKAQVAQVLYNMENQPEVTDRKVFRELKDVYEAEWYADAVAWAYSTGVVTGDLNSKEFSPAADVTREQLALMMYRYADHKGYDVSAASDFAGLKNADRVSNWADTATRWAVGSGMISGIEIGGELDLAPQGTATRAQMAAILQRFCKGYEI